MCCPRCGAVGSSVVCDCDCDCGISWFGFARKRLTKRDRVQFIGQT